MSIYLTSGEWNRLVSGIVDVRDRLIFEFLYSTGCFESELISIKYSDIDFKNRVVLISERRVVLSRRIIPLLEKYVLDNKAHFKNKKAVLFFGRNGNSITPKRVQQLVKKYCVEVLNLDFSPMNIRYTHIQHALVRNIPIVSIQKNTGLTYQRLAQIVEKITTLDDSLDNLSYGYEL